MYGAYRLEVSKGINPDKPRIPVLIDYTSSKIKVKETEGQEFSIDGGKTWTTKGVFKNLKEKKKYTVITRLTETELYQPGPNDKISGNHDETERGREKRAVLRETE